MYIMVSRWLSCRSRGEAINCTRKKGQDSSFWGIVQAAGKAHFYAHASRICGEQILGRLVGINSRIDLPDDLSLLGGTSNVQGVFRYNS